MKTARYILMALAVAALSFHEADARRSGKWTFDLNAGINIGGATPIPMPVEIRELKSFNPLFLPYLEADATYWASPKWGVLGGIRFEYKGMKTVARVKNYGMEIIGDDGSRMAGNWTGMVATRMKNSYVSIPVLAVFKATGDIHVKAGLFGSFLMDGDFGGKVYDGYLREGDPTGDKINFGEDAVAAYEFSTDLSPFHYGVQIGADWRFYESLKLYANLSWSFSDAFKPSFKTITFDMYPVYASLGVGYTF